MGHRLAERAPSADLVQADEKHHRGTDDHNGRMDGIRVGHDAEAADHRDDGGRHSHDQHALHDPPAGDGLQDQRAGIHAEGHLGHDADEKHQAGEAHSRLGTEADFKELGNGEDLVLEVVGHQHRRGETQADGRGQFDGARADAVAVGVAGESHHVFGADIGRKERRADDGPGQRAARQEEAAAVGLLPRPQRKIQAERHVESQRPDADQPISRR